MVDKQYPLDSPEIGGIMFRVENKPERMAAA